MTQEQWRRVREVFERALECDLADRDALLDSACGADPALRREVASLLAAHDDAPEFIESPAWDLEPDLLREDDAGELSGRLVGPYLVRHEIGRGGMGIVYLADDTRLARRVALKAVSSSVDPAQQERLRHEARAAAALSHPGIATVYALEEIDGAFYLASEYVPGATLRTRLKQGPLPARELVDFTVQLARALAAAHAQGIVHRDIKPENVVVGTAGVVKLLDFGVARIESSSDPRLTRTGSTVGTPAYMAPEQIRFGQTDFRTDLFAFGLVIYESASGANPFEAPTSTATIARIIEHDPPPLSQVSPTELPALDAIVATCLKKDPDERYRSTQALLRDAEQLQSALDGSSAAVSLSPAPVHAGDRVTERSRRWWEVHQVIVSFVYALMIYPAWRARIWLPAPWEVLFFFGIIAAAVVTVAVRLHLVFAARSHPADLAAERARARPLTLASDVAFSLALLLAAVAIADNHSSVASLLFSVAIATAISTVVIEPSTTRAAFGEKLERR